KAADAKEPQGEKDELQGVWLLSAIESDGLRLGEGRPEIKDAKAVVAGKTISLDDKDGRRSFAYKLDTAKKPREILLTLQDKKEVFRGIYKADRDTFVLCFAREADARPTDFTADFGSKRWLYTYKREKTDQARLEIKTLTDAVE